jgi:hypothetical protein
MPEGDQDHGGIAATPAITPGCSDQLLHLALGQMLARPELGMGRLDGIDRSTVRFFVAGDMSRRDDLAIECHSPDV